MALLLHCCCTAVALQVLTKSWAVLVRQFFQAATRYEDVLTFSKNCLTDWHDWHDWQLDDHGILDKAHEAANSKNDQD